MAWLRSLYQEQLGLCDGDSPASVMRVIADALKRREHVGAADKTDQ